MPVPILPLLGEKVTGISLYFGQQFGLLTATFAFFSGFNLLACQDYCLIYRYIILQSNPRIYRHFMSKWFTTLLFILAEIVGIVMTYCLYRTFVKPEQLSNYLLAQGYNQKNLKIDPFKDSIILLDTNLKFFEYFSLLWIILFSTSEFFCFVLIYFILRTLKQNSSVFSKNTYRLHLQFTLLLLSQLLTPFIFLFLPVVVCIFAVLMGVPADILTTHIGHLGLVAYGLANSLLTVGFIGPYRLHFYKNFVLILLKPLLTLLSLSHLLPRDRQLSRSTQLSPSTDKPVVLDRRTTVF